MTNKLKMLNSCLLLIGLLSFLSTVNAAPGDLDPTFSQDGKLFDFFSSTNVADTVYGTAVQADGKIVAVGETYFGSVISCGVSRYNTDGTLDSTFDGDGRAIIPTGIKLGCRAVAIQTDGKIVAAGYITGSNDDFAVMRFNTNGSLDTSFDGDGIVITSVGSSHDEAMALAIQPDGKILVAGYSDGTFASDFALVRYNPNGSLDGSFNGGTVTTPVAQGFATDIANAVAIQTDGKIVAAGWSGFSGTTFFSLVRYNADGSIDTTFDSDGKVLTRVNSASTAYAVAIQPDGKIIAAGTSILITGTFPDVINDRDFTLVRYNTDGSLDTLFDSDGIVITLIPTNNEQANAVAIQTDGKIVITGYSNDQSADGNLGVVRYNADGSLDTSFGSSGIVFTQTGAATSAGNALALQTDGRIIAAGISYGSYYDFTVIRYNTNGTLDTSFSSDGITNNDVGFTVSSARAVAIQSNGKIVVAGNDGYIESNSNFAVARYNADGSPDTSFDSDGKVLTSLTNNADEARAVAVQADGKIVVAGTVEVPFGEQLGKDAAVVRYNIDGSLDTSFDSDGMVFIDQGFFDFAYAAAIQPDGKIVLAGYLAPLGDATTMMLIRLNTDGSLDTSFDSDGIVLVSGLDSNQAHAVAIQPDGKIVAAGFARTVSNNLHVLVVRLNGDGSPDNSFDSDGKVLTPIYGVNDVANALTIQPDGKILVAGSAANGSNKEFVLIRYNADGSLDNSFDLNGIVTTSVSGSTNVANAVAIQSNGKIVAAGYTAVGAPHEDFAIVRYNADGSLDPTFSGDGKAAFDLWGSSRDRIYGMALDSNGRAVVAGEASRNFAVARVLGDFVPNANSPFDYDGDGKADISVFRASENKWYILRSSDSLVTQTAFAVAGDIAAPADYDGDGKTDLAVFRPSNGSWWYLSSADNTQVNVQWGASGDIPRPSDFDGDGKTDFVVYRPSNSVWYRYGTTGVTSILAFGSAEDKPLIGDFDGDGKSDPAVFRPSTGDWWYASSVSGQFVSVHWGATGDVPVAADYDGDGKADFAVYRPSNGGWYIVNSSNGSFTIESFGLAEDKPIAADYDGDGKADIAVFRPSTGIWYLQQTTSGFGAVQWGVSTDIPTQNAFIP